MVARGSEHSVCVLCNLEWKMIKYMTLTPSSSEPLYLQHGGNNGIYIMYLAGVIRSCYHR